MKYRIVTGPKMGKGVEWIYYIIPDKGKVQIYEVPQAELQHALDRVNNLRTAASDLFWIAVAEPTSGFPHPDEGKFVPDAGFLSGVLSGSDVAWIRERLMILRAAAPYVPGLSLQDIFVCLDGDHTVKFGSQQVHLKWRIERDGNSLTGLSFKSRVQGKWKPQELERLKFQIKQVVEETLENGQLEPNF